MLFRRVGSETHDWQLASKASKERRGKIGVLAVITESLPDEEPLLWLICTVNLIECESRKFSFGSCGLCR
jgi:hypothetical protein